MFLFLEPYLFKQLTGHRDAITCISFSPTDKQIATGSLDSTIILYNLNDQKKNYKFHGHRKPVTDLTFSAMGKYMASSSEDATVRIWVPKLTGSTGSFRPHTDSVRSVQYCPDESKIITASDDKTVKLTSGSNFKFIRSFVGHTNSVRSARVTNDGAIVASCSADKTIKIWDIDDGNCFHTLKTDRQLAFVAWHPTNMYVAAATQDGQIHLYDIRTYKLLQSYSVHLAPVNQIAFHPDGKHLLSASSDGTMKLIDLSEGHPVFTVKPGGRINAVSFNRSGDSFAAAGDSKMLGIWKTSEELSQEKQSTLFRSNRNDGPNHYDPKKDRSVWYKCYHNTKMPSGMFEHVSIENHSAAFSQAPDANSTEIDELVREDNIGAATMDSSPRSRIDEDVGHSSHIPRTPPLQATYSIPSIVNESNTNDRRSMFGIIKLKENDVCYTSGTIEWVGRKRTFPINNGFKVISESRVEEPLLKRAKKPRNNTSAVRDLSGVRECECADVLPTVNAIVDHLNALHEAVDLVDLRVNTLEDALSKET